MAIEVHVQRIVDSPPSLESKGTELNNKHLKYVFYSVLYAKETGDTLLQLKAEVKQQRKSWEEYLKNHIPAINLRTARLYMQIAKTWDDFLSETATVAENFTLRDAQEAMNARNRKQQPLEPDFGSDFKRSLHKADESIDLFLQNDLDAVAPEALANIVETLATLEHRIASVREKLSNIQEPQSTSSSSEKLNNCLRLQSVTGSRFEGDRL